MDALLEEGSKKFYINKICIHDQIICHVLKGQTPISLVFLMIMLAI